MKLLKKSGIPSETIFWSDSQAWQYENAPSKKRQQQLSIHITIWQDLVFCFRASADCSVRVFKCMFFPARRKSSTTYPGQKSIISSCLFFFSFCRFNEISSTQTIPGHSSAMWKKGCKQDWRAKPINNTTEWHDTRKEIQTNYFPNNR